ncbi:hypothetical protein GGF46_003111 [Coemansia sp. RSA 552]|nr:hypothetical protein GGF46_003111 [Coemansia sp. RSA 552]
MGLARRLYMQWKALRLPWRKDVLIGTDLDGNLYFERAVRGATRMRRNIVYSKKTPVSDYNDKIIPVQWQAWMRHTRVQAPTIAELIQDLQRRERIADNVRRLAANESQAARMLEEGAPSATARPGGDKQAQQAAPGQSFKPEGWHAAAAGVKDRRR